MAKIQADTISAIAQAPQNVSNNVLPITVTESRIFKLSNDKRRGKVIIDVEEDVIDPDTGRQRRMRLLRGSQSIWMDEQPPTVFPEKYVNKNILSLEFNNGVLIVPVNDPLRIKAATISNSNMGVRKEMGSMAKHRPYYFYEWNPVEQNKKAIQEENDVIKAMQLAMTTPIAEVIPHAQYLNIQFVDEMGLAMNEEALRMAYTRYAKNNATKFLNSAQSPTVKIAHMVRKAIDGGLVDLGKQAGAAYWTDGGFISTLPQGRDAIEYLIEFAMTHGDSNAMFANQLRELTS
jgi:hypothetical protein